MMSVEGEEKYACSVNDIESTGKLRLKIDGRDILLTCINQTVYALDSFCYHAGGPLYNGDIEELGGRWCIVCPWHKYKVCLNTGQNYYQSINPYSPLEPPVLKAGEVRQRMYKVIIRGGKIFVKFSLRDKQLDSDRYNK